MFDEAAARLHRWRSAAALPAGPDAADLIGRLRRVPGRRPRHPEGACRRRRVVRGRTGVRRTRPVRAGRGGGRGRRTAGCRRCRNPVRLAGMSSVNDKSSSSPVAPAGVGADVARRLRRKNAKLVLTDIDAAPLAELAAELGEDHVLTAVADVRDLSAMQAVADRAVERFGGIDVVVANAGIATYGSVLQVDPEAFKRLMDINVNGVLPHRARHAALDHRPARLRADRVVVRGLLRRARTRAVSRLEGRHRALRQRAARSRSPTTASTSARRTCRGSTPRWSRTPRRTSAAFGRCWPRCPARWARPPAWTSAARRSSRASRAASGGSTYRAGSARSAGCARCCRRRSGSGR